MSTTPLLLMRGVRKRFPGVTALDGVTLEVRAGEIHALVGENGAGKSTLIRIAAGLERADDGVIELAGAPIAPATPAAARALGIALVHQEPDLFPDLSVAENMLLGHGLPVRALGWIDWSAAWRKAEQALAALDERIDVRQPGRALGAAARQLVDIAAALAQDARVLFLDEPTAALSRKESEALFARLRRLREQGAAIVYVSHRLGEVLALADRVTVLRDGRLVWTRPAAGLSEDDLVAAMVGRALTTVFARGERTPGAPRLQVEGLSTPDRCCRNIDLTLRAGEVVGLYGLVGAGRSELAQALAGLRPRTGSVIVDGAPLPPAKPEAALRAGVAYVPEDRLDQGIFLDLSIADNAVIAHLSALSTAGVVRSGRARVAAARLIETLRVKATDLDDGIDTLSGGNQQKVILGRRLMAEPAVLLLDEPTRGVDVGAKADIHALIQRAAGDGAAVLLISSELPEVMAVSDRVLVMREGGLAGEFDPRAHSEADVAAAAFPRGAAGEPPTATHAPHRRGMTARREWGLAGLILALSAALTATTEAFPRWGNLSDILHNMSATAIAGVGMTLVIAAGAIDISIGSMLALTACAVALAVKGGATTASALALGVSMGAALGLLNAALSIAGRIHTIIVTLGTISIYRAVLILWTDGKWVTELPASFTWLGKDHWLGVPIAVWAMAACVAGGAVFQARFRAGRMLYAVGGNPRAARTVGLSSARSLLLAFGSCGALVGLAAVFYAARLGSVQTNAALGFELRVIAATVIGGANIMGGSGTALGTMLGALLIELLYNARVLWNVSAYWEQLTIGALILAAVLLDARRRGRSAER